LGRAVKQTPEAQIFFFFFSFQPNWIGWDWRAWLPRAGRAKYVVGSHMWVCENILAIHGIHPAARPKL